MSVDARYDQEWASLFYYDETSPSGLRWLVDRFRGRKRSQIFIKAGDIVGSLNCIDGYWHVHTFGKMFNAHNIVWRMFGRKQDGLFLDHEDGDTSNNNISNLRLTTHKGNMQNKTMFSSNKSGVTGVCRRDIKSRHGCGRFNSYWIAQWRGTDDKVKSASFSIDKHGESAAFNMACEHRSKMIAELNEQGAGYTERHGT